MTNRHGKAYAKVAIAGLLLTALLLVQCALPDANKTEITINGDLTGKILIRIWDGSDHNFVFLPFSKRITPLRKTDVAGMSKERFVSLFDDYFEEMKTRRHKLIPKLEESLDEKNVALLQKWADHEYDIAVKIQEKYPLPPGERDEFMDRFIDIRSIDGNVVLEHANPGNFFPNEQMTHAVFAYGGIDFPRNKALEKTPLLDLNTLTASSLNVKGVGDDPSEIFRWSPDGKYLAIGVTEGSERLSYRLAILDVQANEIVYSREFESAIDTLAWSPDSKHISVMSKVSRRKHGPLEWLFALAGHPVPYDTFYLDIMSIQGLAGPRIKVIKDVPYGRSTLLWVE